MQIGLLTSDLSYHHGWGNYSLNVIAELQNLGHKVEILTSRNSADINNFTLHRVLPQVHPQERFTVPKMVLAYPRIAKIFKNCDVIHSTIEIYAPLLPLISRGRPTFMTAHGSYINLPSVRKFPMNNVYQWAFSNTNIVCVSHYTASIARQMIPDASINVIHNAVDVDKFTSLNRQVTDTPIIVTLGGVKRRKGTLELVNAIADIRDTFPDVQCVVLGSIKQEKYYVERVRQAITQHNLENNVHILGRVDDAILQDYYAKANVFVLPSIDDRWKFEGFGLATLEASASGLPVIGTYGSGAEDAIDDGITGLLVSQDNIAQALPQAIKKLLSDKALANQMGVAGRQKALSHTWADVAQQLTQLYTQKLER